MKPTYTLHKLPQEGFIITSDEEYKNNDLVLLPISYEIAKCINGTTFIEGTIKVIAQQDQIDFSSLSIEEQKEIGWFDVEKLAKNIFDSNEFNNDSKLSEIHLSSIVKIIQKAQSLLSDRRFTLEDVQLAFAKGAAYITKPYPQNVQFENEYKQSLSQKSWKIELVMTYNVFTSAGTSDLELSVHGLQDVIFSSPKLTNGKIKILKLC